MPSVPRMLHADPGEGMARPGSPHGQRRAALAHHLMADRSRRTSAIRRLTACAVLRTLLETARPLLGLGLGILVFRHELAAERRREVARRQRLVQDLPDAGGLQPGRLEQAAVAGHQQDRQLGP